MDRRVKQHHVSAIINYEEALKKASKLANFLHSHTETDYKGDFSTVETYLDDKEAEKRIESILPELQRFRSGFLQESNDYNALKRTQNFNRPEIEAEHKFYTEMFNDLEKEVTAMMTEVEKILEPPKKPEVHSEPSGYIKASDLYNTAD